VATSRSDSQGGKRKLGGGNRYRQKGSQSRKKGIVEHLKKFKFNCLVGFGVTEGNLPRGPGGKGCSAFGGERG